MWQILYTTFKSSKVRNCIYHLLAIESPVYTLIISSYFEDTSPQSDKLYTPSWCPAKWQIFYTMFKSAKVTNCIYHLLAIESPVSKLIICIIFWRYKSPKVASYLHQFDVPQSDKFCMQCLSTPKLQIVYTICWPLSPLFTHLLYASYFEDTSLPKWQLIYTKLMSLKVTNFVYNV